jgi:transposase InsO family protein
VNRLREQCLSSTPGPDRTARRGLPRQQQQRQREQLLRAHLVELAHWTSALGRTQAQAAELLQLSARTLRHWDAALRAGTLTLHALGRPTQRSGRATRQAVLEMLDELGPALGLPTLHESFPSMARAELQDLLCRYRRVWRLTHQHAPYVLRWPVAGPVWALDFTDAPAPLDGLYPYLLALRDLGSGQQLLWLPLAQTTAEATVAALEPLFLVAGAPLVLKSDNGPAFCAGAVLDLLQRWGIIPLFSPPYWPRYNGSIEAGIGSLKTRTEQQATHHGRPTQWTWDDAAAAQAQANATARPRGPDGPTPDQLWQTRRPITPEERSLFATTLAHERVVVRVQDGWPTDGPLPARDEADVERQAIRRALERHGYLHYARRRIPLPFTKKKVANNT